MRRALSARKAAAPCGREPPLDEILADPMARLLMRRDGVDEAGLRRFLAELSRRLRRECEPARPTA